MRQQLYEATCNCVRIHSVKWIDYFSTLRRSLYCFFNLVLWSWNMQPFFLLPVTSENMLTIAFMHKISHFCCFWEKKIPTTGSLFHNGCLRRWRRCQTCHILIDINRETRNTSHWDVTFFHFWREDHLCKLMLTSWGASATISRSTLGP